MLHDRAKISNPGFGDFIIWGTVGFCISPELLTPVTPQLTGQSAYIKKHHANQRL